MTDQLNILWTNADPVTAEKMVFMYARNSLLKGWWKKVRIIIWGATAKLAAENEMIKGQIEIFKAAGGEVTACIACATQLGVKEQLEEQGIEVKSWGPPLTELLKNDAKLLTV